MKKRLLALLLTVVMLVTMLPVQAFAAEDGEDPEVPEATEAAAIPETTAAPIVPETTAAPTVPETTAAPTVPETTQAPTVPETTQAPTVPETTEATVPEATEETVPETTPPLAIAGDTLTTGSCGTNLSWNLQDGNHLYISSDDASQASVMDNYTEENPAPWSAYASDIDKVIMTDANISTIGNNAFAGFSRVNAILLPQTLSEIKLGIFQDCAMLTDFQFGNGNQSGFRGGNAFLLKDDGEQCSLCVVGPGCSPESGEFTVPADVNRICSKAFAGCSKITSLTFQGAAPDVDSNAFAGMSSSITVNYDSALDGWDTLTAREDLGASITWNPLPTSDSCGQELHWEVSGNTLTIHPGDGTGGMMDNYTAENPAPWKKYADQITTINMTGGITIGDNAFTGLTKVTTVNLPETLMYFTGVFGDCTSLQTFAFPNGNDNGYSIASDGKAIVRDDLGEMNLYAVAPTVAGEYTVPDNVTAIHYGAFAGCSKITKITFPRGLGLICNDPGCGAFTDCTVLTELVFQSPIPNFEDGVFTGLGDITVVFDPYNTDGDLLEHQTFGAKSVTWLPQYPENSEYSGSCGQDLYWEVSGNTLTIHPGDGTGGMMVYYTAENPAPWKQHADQITTINMTGGITIGDNAFAGLTKVTTVNLPSSLKYFTGVFGDCTSLQTFAFPNGNGYGYSIASDGKAIVREDYGHINLYAVAPTVAGEYTVPSNVTAIHYGAFAGCSNITKITFPANLSLICGSGISPTFSGCGAAELVFAGPAPSLEEGSFTGLGSVTVTFPGNKDGWDACQDMDLGAQVTWNNTHQVTITNAPASLVSGKYVTLKATSTNGSAITWALDEHVYEYRDGEGYLAVGAEAEGPKASDYATISSSSGKLTAKKPMGQSYYVRVTASSKGAVPAEAYIRMIPLTSKITFSDSLTGEANVGSTYTVDLNDPDYEGKFSLFAQGLPLGANSKLSWSFSSAAKNLVTRTSSTNESGVSGYDFTTKGKTGSFTITVSAGDGSKVTRKITVKLVKYAHDLKITHSLKQRLLGHEGDEPVYGYAVRGGSKVTLSTNVAASKSFTDKTVKWTVDCPKLIATIDSKGVLTTYAVPDQYPITVTATYPATGKTDTLEITLLPAVDGIYIAAERSSNTYALLPEVEERGLSKEALSAWDIADGNIRLKATCLPDGSMSEGTWSVSSTKIADFARHEDGSLMVDEYGFLTLLPKKAGKVTVTFTTSDGTKTKATKTINFIAPVHEFTVTPDTVTGTLTSGDTLTFQATAWTIEDSVKASTQQFYWWLSEPFEYTDDYGEIHTDYLEPDYASISSSGRLTIGTVTRNATLTLSVNCVDSNGNWFSAEPITIQVQPKQEKTLVLRQGHPEWGGYDYLGASYTSCPNCMTLISCAWYDRTTGEYTELTPEETVKITSSNTKVVSITSNSDYPGYKEMFLKNTTGTATITAECGGQKATLKVTNKYLPSRIQVTTKIPSYLRSGSTLTLKATVWTDYYDNEGNIVESYKSSSQKVYWEGPYQWNPETDSFVLDDEYGNFIPSRAATISSSGKITAKTVSKAETVAFICYFNAYDSYAQAIIPITIRPKADYKATLYFTNPYGNEDAYSGTVNYPINIDGYKSISADMYELSVYDAVNDQILSDDQIAKIAWKSSSTSIAKFDSGTLNFLKKGAVTITGTATLTNGKTVSASVKLKVVNAIKDITLGVKGGKNSLCSAASLTMTAKLGGSPSSTKLIWQVADVVDGAPDWDNPSKYATISSSGVLKAEKVYNGQYPIAVRAISADFGFAQSEPVFLTVCPKTTAFAIRLGEDGYLNNVTKTLDYGTTYDLYVEIYPENVICQKLTWSSSSNSVAEVISQEIVDGVVHVRLKVKKKGSATIKATTTDGTKLSVSFKVTSKNKFVPQPAPQ